MTFTGYSTESRQLRLLYSPSFPLNTCKNKCFKKINVYLSNTDKSPQRAAHKTDLNKYEKMLQKQDKPELRWRLYKLISCSTLFSHDSCTLYFLWGKKPVEFLRSWKSEIFQCLFAFFRSSFGFTMTWSFWLCVYIIMSPIQSWCHLHYL